jgi:hypothetical protein
VAFLEPSIALTTCETALRALMTHVYAEKLGSGWLDRVVSADKLSAWAGRADEEARARGTKGVVVVPGAGLAYANLYDLIAIAEKHWEPLAPALGPRAKALPLINRLNSLRNAVGHSRPLLPFEQDLMSGIAGQIRNQVTIFMSAQDEAGDIYPRIESISDGFGRRIESATVTGEVAGSVQDRTVIVHPGETVLFECVGTDPQGRPLSWSLGRPHRGRSGLVGPSGGVTAVQWTVTDDDVTETRNVEIYLATEGAKYHRFGDFDHRAYFAFKVRPPR